MAIEKKRKTNHQTGWHKRVTNPTTNYPPSGHKQFCKRCHEAHNGCPVTGTIYTSDKCDL